MPEKHNEPDDRIRITCPHCRGGLLMPIRYCPVCGGYGTILVDRVTYLRERENERV